MNLELNDRVCIVLGSSRGIGRGIAAALLEEGARVVLTGRDADSLRAAERECLARHPGRVLACTGDAGTAAVLASIETVARTTWGRIDGVVANAGAVRPVDGWRASDADWHWYLDSNLLVHVRALTHFIPQLIASKGAAVVISSIAGIEDVGAPLPYAAAKAALAMYAKGLARQLGASGVRVNTIAPGNVLFPGGNWDRRRQADPAAVDAMIASRVPLGTFGDPGDVAALAAFLLSPRARFITGSCFVVDGGQTVQV